MSDTGQNPVTCFGPMEQKWPHCIWGATMLEANRNLARFFFIKLIKPTYLNIVRVIRISKDHLRNWRGSLLLNRTNCLNTALLNGMTRVRLVFTCNRGNGTFSRVETCNMIGWNLVTWQVCANQIARKVTLRDWHLVPIQPKLVNL